METRGVSGRLAKYSSQRPWRIALIWALLAAVCVAITIGIPPNYTTDVAFTNNPESERGAELIAQRMTQDELAPTPDELVVVASDEFLVEDPAFQAFVGQLIGELMATDEYVQFVAPYYQTGEETLVSDDRHAMVIPVFAQEGNPDVHPLIDVVEENDGRDGFTVVIGGAASVEAAFIDITQEDLLKGETIGVSVALLVLVLVFGSLVAAGVPLLMALFAITTGLGLTAVVGHFTELSIFVINMLTMLGLALGIDYTLFIVGRYREERRHGWSIDQAIVRTGDSATKAVFFSGLTVVTALMGMLLVPSSIFQSLATGAIIVVIFSVLATLTLLPATLRLLGDRIEVGRGRGAMAIVGAVLAIFAGFFVLIDVGEGFIIAYLVIAAALLIMAVLNLNPLALRSESSNGSFWDRLARVVMRFPIPLVSVTTLLLIGATLVYLTINLGESGISSLPPDNTSYRAFQLVDQRFSALSLEAPTEIVVDGAVETPEVQVAIEELMALTVEDPAFGPPMVSVDDGGALVVVSLLPQGDSQSLDSLEAIDRLRDDYIPSTFAGVDAEVLVTGPSAFSVDFNQVVSDYTPIVFGFVLSVSLVLLLLAFRSLVVPIKSVIMNLLSVGASYGLLVLVFQHGVGNELFGFQQVERIDAWIPLLMFTILFGLSMDYHVFMLSRIREHYDESRSNTESVAYGLRTTASIITGAALIMVAVFGGFAMGDLTIFQQMGFGLAVSVILDATIIRSVLVPASMRLLGDWNWYLPSWLSWLPRVNIEGEPVRTAADSVAAGDD